MHRQNIPRLAVSVLALAMLGAPCSTTGPQPRDFPAGSLVIPMDNCYQKRDASSPSQSVACNTTSDDGVFRAYGLVYYLLKKGVTVYWAIDGATPKATPAGPDLVVPAPASGPVVRKYDWASGQVVPYTPSFPDRTGITYLGGPFVIDAADKPRALGLLASDPDIARVRNRQAVDIHEVQEPFHANQVRPLSGTPPKLAILNVNPQPYHKTSVDVMYRYAVAAGFDWPCTPASGDCAGGLGPGCDATVIRKYLDNTLCGTGSACSGANPQASGCSSCTNWVSPAITAAQFNPPGVPGLVYDVLCDGDFTAASGLYADSQLATGGYKLVWAPHWDTGGVDPGAPAGATLGQQLRNLASFVAAGNNLFAECAAIGALETGRIDGSGTLLRGVAETRFQSTAGMNSTVNANQGTNPPPFLAPQHPNLQVGDFAFSQVGGAITNYYPDRAGSTSAYRAGVERLVTSTLSPPWDIASTVQVTTADGVKVGTVAYLGGHDYSPAPSGSGGQTAGTRIVLNTLFNLGFACADPNTTCPTGYPSNSACATGALKCSAAGGLTCVPNVQPGQVAEICGNGIDDDCDGQIDEGCSPPPVCTGGDSRPCYDGPAGTAGSGACRAGTQTCTGGAWGACQGQVLPSPEACNGRDDDCNGQVDEGTLCPFGVCSGGVCLPQPCGSEARCPAGFTCTGVSPSSACTPNPCPTQPCGPGLVCSGGSCVDPCAGVLCGTGSTCSGGVCFGGACYTVPCTGGRICRAGACIDDPCAALSCPAGTFCRAGDCVRSCASVQCPSGKRCDADGMCVADAPCSPSCGAGQVCQGGSCVADPCAGVGCGTGQVCRGGACVDPPCAHVQCPGGGTCQEGQCTSTSPIATPATTPSKSGCGCGSAGGAELLGLLFALTLWPRLRRRAAFRPASLLALAVAFGLSACGKSTSSESCPSGATLCGSLCCSSGSTCSSGACVLPTGNPVLRSIDPPSASVGGPVNLNLAGEAFQSGAVARLVGSGLSLEVPLLVTSDTAASAPVDLAQARTGPVEVRVVNPGHLVSNALALTLTNDPVPLGLDRTSIRQDAGVVDVVVSGRSFGPGIVASLALGGGTPQAQTTEYLSPSQIRIKALDAGAHAVGVYDVTVALPGGPRSPAVKLPIIEGAPTLTSILPTCGTVGQTLVGTATGQYLYPTSVVHVSVGTDSPLETRCKVAAPDAVGQCQGGELNAVADLTSVPAGTYQVWVRNPGVPPLESARRTFTVSATTCP